MIRSMMMLGNILLFCAAWTGVSFADEMNGPRGLLDLPKTPTATRNSEGDVIRTRDGRFLMAYTLYTGAEDTRYGSVDDAAAADIAVRWSTDGGESWSAPTVAVKRPPDCQNVMSVSLLRLRNGTIAMFYCRKKSGRDCRPAMRVSTDEGRTWGAETMCVADADVGYYVLNNARARQLKSGRLALPLGLHRVRTGRNGEDDWESAAELMCALSDDDGRTWRLSKGRRYVRDAQGKTVVTQEPGLVELKDGRLMMWARTDRRSQWRLFSRDGGETWSGDGPMPGVVSADLAPATIERLDNGDLVMTWNDHSGARAQREYAGFRAPMTIAVSRDEGETWIHKKDLYRAEKGLWTCYYSVRQFGDRLWILHCWRDSLSTSRLTEVPLAWLYRDPPRDFAAWPFVTMRQMSGTCLREPEKIREMARINARHPGSADEFWLGSSGYLKWAVRDARAVALDGLSFCCERCGVGAGFQQGVTLGHDFTAGKPDPDACWFPEDAYQVDVDGTRTAFYCPRSPDVLKVEEEYARQYVQRARLRSYWLDDDLRTGFCKFRAEGCWCDRCVAALNAKAGTKMTREEWVKRLSSDAETDPLRAVWSEAKGESLALFAAAARRGAKKADPAVRMGYQAISSDSIHCGADFRPILAALSDGFREPVGIRAGHGCWDERDMRDALPRKLLGVAREAERCRRYPGWKGTVTYEEENYPHALLQKTPETTVREAALGLAAGCDAVSLYWYSTAHPEPLTHYEELAELTAAWRPYLERLAAISKRTHLGGIARAADPNLMTGRKNTIPYLLGNDGGLSRRQSSDAALAGMGVPVTVAEAGCAVVYEPDEMRIAPGASLETGLSAALDRLDRKPNGPICVRTDKVRRLLVYPRVDEAGRTVAVTFANVGLGVAKAVPVRVRRPLSGRAVVARPAEKDAALACRAGEGDEVRFVLPDLPAWGILTVFF